MSENISKTDYILYRECPKNAWMKIHRPDVYYALPLSDFEKHIIDTGNDVELVARGLFPTGVLIEGRGVFAEEETARLVAQQQSVIFQPIFAKDGFLAAADILTYDESAGEYAIYEVKASNTVDKKVHVYDLAFQVILLRKCGLNVTGINLIHLNKEYVRRGELEITKLFTVDDVREEVEEIIMEVEQDMERARVYLLQEKEPGGACCCIYKGRSGHCTTFKHSSPEIPEYGVHDLSRIGMSKKKLMELVDGSLFHLHEIDGRVKLNETQENQIDVHVNDRAIIKKGGIAEELGKLEYPLYFLDYETFPSAVPLFDGYSPYNQIPFQYSLHVLETPERELQSHGFLHVGSDDPGKYLAASLASRIGPVGSVIVWYKLFETARNKELADRMPEYRSFFESVNERVFDLMEIFSKQQYVHKDFRGSSSIKKVLPVLVPELSYKDLEIQDGGTASQIWKKIFDGENSGLNEEELAENLKKYCERDTYAMYAIWKVLSGPL